MWDEGRSSRFPLVGQEGKDLLPLSALLLAGLLAANVIVNAVKGILAAKLAR